MQRWCGAVSKEFPDFPDDKNRAAHKRLLLQIATLEKNLLNAFSSEARNLNEKRLLYVYALMIIAEYLEKMTGSKELGNPFFKLAGLLDDLNHGITPDFFKSSRGRSRRPDPTEVWRKRALVVLEVEWLHRDGFRDGGLALEDAIKKVAQNKDLKALLRPGTSPTSCIARWHKHFMRGIIKNEVAQSEFNARLAVQTRLQLPA